MSINRQQNRSDDPGEPTDDIDEPEDELVEDGVDADEVEERTAVPERRSASTASSATGTRRATPRQFLHEVNVEMRKVVWPSRAETINYSSVVLVTLAFLMALIFVLDLAFTKFAKFIFT